MKGTRENRGTFAPPLLVSGLFLGLSVLVLPACRVHTPTLNREARAQHLATLETADDLTKEIPVREIRDEDPAPKRDLLDDPKRADPPKSFVSPDYEGATHPDATTLGRYPFFRKDGLAKLPVIFPRHVPGSAYLVQKENRMIFEEDAVVTEAPHSGLTFEPGKRQEPSNEDPYTTLPGTSEGTSLSFGLGPVHGAVVEGRCTAGSCVREPYFLLTYDPDMENRLKVAPRPSWKEISEEKDWKVYLLEPRFTAFRGGAPVPLRFDRGQLRMERSDGQPWLSGIAVGDDKKQPLEAKSKKRSLKLYRLKEGEIPLLIGMITEGKSETWFLAVPASLSEPDGK